MRSQNFDSCWCRKGTWLDEVLLDQLPTRFAYYSASGEKERIAFTSEKRKRWMNGLLITISYYLQTDVRLLRCLVRCSKSCGRPVLRSHRLRENSHVPVSNIHSHTWSSWQYVRPDHRNKLTLYTILPNFHNLSRNLNRFLDDPCHLTCII